MPKDTGGGETGQAKPAVQTAVTRFAPTQYATSRQSDTSHATRSAANPGAIWPRSPARPRAAAAFTVEAISASACRRPSCETARLITNGRPGVGEEPGLKSVARATAAFASIRRRAGA